MQIHELLVEAQDYTALFNDLLKADPNNSTQLRPMIEANIRWAKTTLKKNDRIVWYLRYAKILLSRLLPAAAPPAPSAAPIAASGQPTPAALAAAARERTSPYTTALASFYKNGAVAGASAMEQSLAAYNQRYKTQYTLVDLLSTQEIQRALQHFLGLPIPEIQSYVFRYESPNEIIALFGQYEEKWRDNMADEKTLLSPEDGDEELITFPDGYSWFRLDRGACSAEADAMGHCGNVPSERHGDEILSLRRKVQKGDIVKWYPVATFILNDGVLGEMKGRNNDKPQEKYHPYIVALLQHHIITGIKGGGYMPSHNFSIQDLDPNTREQLIANKPELASFEEYYRKEGMTPRVMDLLTNQMSEKGVPDFKSYDAANKEFVLDNYRSLEDFCQTNDDTVVSGLLDLREKVDEVKIDVGNLSARQLYDFLDQLPNRSFNEIAAQMGIDPTDSNAEKMMARQLEAGNSPIYDRIEYAFSLAANPTELMKSLDERIDEYIENGWSFECSSVWLTFVNKDDLYNSEVEIRIAEQDLVNIVSSDEEGDDEYGYDLQKVANSRSWDNVDWDNQVEHRREEGLISKKRSKRGYHVDAEFPDPENINFEADDILEKAIDIFVSGRASPTVNDPRQMQLPNMPPRNSIYHESFDLEIENLRRRAGLVMV